MSSDTNALRVLPGRGRRARVLVLCIVAWVQMWSPLLHAHEHEGGLASWHMAVEVHHSAGETRHASAMVTLHADGDHLHGLADHAAHISPDASIDHHAGDGVTCFPGIGVVRVMGLVLDCARDTAFVPAPGWLRPVNGAGRIRLLAHVPDSSAQFPSGRSGIALPPAHGPPAIS